jgi:hypothetical protein
MKLDRENIALCYLTAPSLEKAYEMANVSKATLYRLRNQDDFKETVEQIKQRLFNDTLDKLQANCLTAVQALISIAEKEEATDGARINAAKTIIDFGINSVALNDITKRLDELERRINDEAEHSGGS